MSYFIIIVLCLILLIMIIHLVTNNTYKKLLIGTIVGKYKGNLTNGGFMVVEFEVKDKQTYKEIKIQQTYEVPQQYYTDKKIGDTGLFPVRDKY